MLVERINKGDLFRERNKGSRHVQGEYKTGDCGALISLFFICVAVLLNCGLCGLRVLNLAV